MVKGRQQVKRVLNKCVIYKKLHSRPFDELAAPMPIKLIRKAKPFHQSGVDFAGSLYYKTYKFEHGGSPGEVFGPEERVKGQPSEENGHPPPA